MRQRARLASVIDSQNDVHELLAKFGREDFEDLTKGQIKTKTLRAMGHPFARQRVRIQGAQRGVVKGSAGQFKNAGLKGQVNARGVVKRLPINIQKGTLRRGIRLVYRGGSSREFVLFSSAPHAKYVLHPKGTDLMVPRGMLGPNGELRKRHKARIQTVIDIVRKKGQAP